MEVTLGTLLIICGIIMIAALLSTNISGLVVSTHGDTMLSDRLQKRLDSSADDDNGCDGLCTTRLIEKDCLNTHPPVLGGLDVVEFYSFPNESYVGITGSKHFQSKYGDYVFFFKDVGNKKKFESSPLSYAPSWGGFCAWGIAAEFCPDYPYSSGCLGPGANYGHWSIVQDRLFLFRHSGVKASFLENSGAYVEAGDRRWNRWFGDDSSKIYSTNCYVNETFPDDDNE